MNLFLLVFLFGVGFIQAGIYENNVNEYDIKDQDISEDDISRPCALSDWQCMRNFLAANSNCKPSYGPIPDPIRLPLDKFFIPAVNITITHTDLKVSGFRRAKITEFYINKETGNVVIAINVQKMNQTSLKTFFTYQRTGKEPIIRSDFTTVLYDSATFTAVIPKAPRLQLDKAEIHADIHDYRPVYSIGPRINNSTDPDVIAAFASFTVNIPTIIQEAFVFQSSLLTAIYIESYLCDFGISSYKNYLSFIGTKGYNQALGFNRDKLYRIKDVYV